MTAPTNSAPRPPRDSSSQAPPCLATFREVREQLLIRDAGRLQRVLANARGRGFDEARFMRDLQQAQARAERRRQLIPQRLEYPPELPVTQARERLLEALRAYSVVVVCGETGSGKSTQLPKLLLEAGCGRRGLVGHTQPRRLAARTLAQRIAQETQSPLGDLVGYETRFDRRVSERTVVKLMTDGILLAELGRDRWLENYDAIIVDEAHERTLNIDFLLGRLRQIHARRPELKIVITSATLDPERLSAHFGNAPILTVEGRTYPVEIRYREPAEDAELEDQVAAAVDDVWRGGRHAGDTLVFLPGEREINELVRVLGGRFPHAQVLPLYTRLPAAQQDRAFTPGGPPKIICATNVAETSVTVPGIRYVIDAGTARVNRYSTRLGVQHLEIEPVSQAAASQRAGRCGRVGPGVCVRLYSEEDFLSRPAFSDPEIRRVNLAGVILQMAALDLGAVDEFPWIDPPEPRHVTEGYRVLQVLAAMDAERQLTPLGRALSRLPLDPRVARIALAGRGQPCEDAVFVLAAALSVQDPHEVPPDAQTQARQQHAAWRHPRSDFLTLLSLWRQWQQWSAANGKRALRRVCGQHYVSYTRMLEWDALYRQIVDLLRERGAENAGRATELTPDELYEPLHKALLAGLIDHIGQKRPEPVKKGGRSIVEYIGPRGRRFRIFPGSALAKKAPDWLMCAQLLQTSDLFARTAAEVRVPWLEQAGAHLLKRTVTHPQWNARRGEVTAVEHVSLLGLPLAQKLCHYAAHDAAGARAIFIRDALVRGQMADRPAFVDANLALADAVRDKEARLRRPDLLADEDQFTAFYDARLPPSVCTVAALKRWLRDAPEHAAQVTMGEPDVLRPGADPDAASLFPDHFDVEGLRLPLSYRHDPGSNADGMTVHVPLALLHRLHDAPFEWLVPGLRPALFEGLIRTLPNAKRRLCTPAAAWAQALYESVSPAQGALLPALCARFRAMNGVELEPGDFDPAALDAYLRPWFVIEDEQGTALAQGGSLVPLQSRLRDAARASLRGAADGWQRDGVTRWDFGELPEEVALSGGGVAVPALTVEAGAVALRLFESRAAAAQAQREGQRALFLQQLPDRLRDLRKTVKNRFGMTLIGTALTPEGLLDELVRRVADEIIGDGLLRTPADFDAAVARRQQFSLLAQQRLDEIAGWLEQGSQLRRKLAADGARWPDSAADLRAQLDSLLQPGLVRALPAVQWPRVGVWLRAAALRWERLANKPQRDLELTRQIAPLAAAVPDAFHPARWMLEELRVQWFAQELRAAGAPTPEKVRAQLAAAGAPTAQH
jgi:ATP-dependent helicase HrpA